mmetsp:Transcript_53239/g.134530  ORF Transcript_53239/g.134530 Transcript_53239/m.134530 type:complete len:263 (+) Transcript_53239:1503-2291(+)
MAERVECLQSLARPHHRRSRQHVHCSALRCPLVVYLDCHWCPASIQVTEIHDLDDQRAVLGVGAPVSAPVRVEGATLAPNARDGVDWALCGVYAACVGMRPELADLHAAVAPGVLRLGLLCPGRILCEVAVRRPDPARSERPAVMEWVQANHPSIIADRDDPIPGTQGQAGLWDPDTCAHEEYITASHTLCSEGLLVADILQAAACAVIYTCWEGDCSAEAIIALRKRDEVLHRARSKRIDVTELVKELLRPGHNGSWLAQQ